MYPLEKIKKNIAKKINQILGGDFVVASMFVYPPQAEMGDLSLPLFQVAKNLNTNPVDLGARFLEELSSSELEELSSLNTAGPYLNFKINSAYLAEELFGEIDEQKEKFGSNDSGEKERVMIEYSNGNTHKECHIGHVRNISYGDSIYRILSANGFEAIPVSYINDFGIHVAKTLWAYLEFHKDEALPENKGYFLGQVYAEATKKMDEIATGKQMVQFMMKKIESRQGEEYKLWQQTRQWTIEQLENIYKELDIKFAHTYYENEFVDQGREMVDELIAKGILKHSQGAVIADLEEEKLGVLVVLRSDGTALYPVADIPLMIEKFNKFKLDKSITVTDDRQGQYFKQLFNILNKLEFKQEMVHLGYEHVKLPSGMISSRSGNIISYEDLRDELLKKTLEETSKRHTDWEDKKIKSVARSIANGAMKFEMLKVGADQVITFDINKALEFSGYTAAYIQYTYARINSIIRKAGIVNREAQIEFKNLIESKEQQLIMKLAKYPEIVMRAGSEFNPSEIAKYIFDLSQLVNDYYHSVPVLKSEAETMKARLALLSSSNQIIKNGLSLLGIEVVEEM